MHALNLLNLLNRRKILVHVRIGFIFSKYVPNRLNMLKRLINILNRLIIMYFPTYVLNL